MDFTDEELRALRENPNVVSVTRKRITYASEFKEKFIKEYSKGIGPCEIFTRAGFDVNVLGNKRIERASYRWRRMQGQEMLGKQKKK